MWGCVGASSIALTGAPSCMGGDGGDLAHALPLAFQGENEVAKLRERLRASVVELRYCLSLKLTACLSVLGWAA
jgi:hypothetical protein